MSEINDIEIYINNIGIEKYIKIFPKERKILIGSITKDISEEKINELLRIIRLWNNTYDNKLIDGEEFTIKIVYKDNVEKISGKGLCEKNYKSFRKWISDICD